MTDSIQLIIFDCDGVIVDSEKIVMTIFGEGLRELGLDYSLNELFDKFVGPSVESCNDMVAQLLGRPLPEGFEQQQIKRTEIALRQSLKPVNGIPDILSQLNCDYCLASNSGRQKITTCLTATNLMPYFSDKIFSAVEDVSNEKPAPDIYLHAAKTMGVTAQHCLVIEDTPTGVQAGVAAGMMVLGYSECMSAQRLQQAGAHLTFDDMTKLPQIIRQLSLDCAALTNPLQ